MQKRYLTDCFLVVGGIQAHGCVRYTHTDREEELKGNVEKSEWQTHKVVSNVSEQKVLNATRIELERMVSALGAHLNGFGFIIPMSKEKELNEVLKGITARIKEYKVAAKDTELTAWLSVFQVKSTDESIAAALYSKTVQLLDDVKEALKNGNIEELRKALNGMRGLDQVLPPDRGKKIVSLIDTARSSARDAVKQVKSMSEKKQVEMTKNLLKELESGVSGVRASFIEVMEELDLSAGVTSTRVVELV